MVSLGPTQVDAYPEIVVYVRSLRIRNFRCFGQAELRFQHPEQEEVDPASIPNVNLIVGDNGGGKSSILRAVALAILADALPGSGYVPYRLVRRPGSKTARINVTGMLTGHERTYRRSRDSIEFEVRLKRGPGSNDFVLPGSVHNPFQKILYDDFSSDFFLAGYGATRRTEIGEYSESSARKSRAQRYQRVASLFEDHITLRPLQSWLPRLRGRQRAEVSRVLNLVLPSNIRFENKYDPIEGQFLFNFDGRQTPFSALSDGYKAFVGWVGELLGHLVEVSKGKLDLDEIPGIVLVDEIDLHLHPEWQRHVVPMLATAFPKIQFICTTHSPLVASNVHRSNLFLTETSKDGTSTIKQSNEQAFGRSADQLLLSSYFGLKSTRPDAFRNTSKKLFKEAAEGDTQAALRYLEELSGNNRAVIISGRPDAVKTKFTRRKIAMPVARKVAKKKRLK